MPMDEFFDHAGCRYHYQRIDTALEFAAPVFKDRYACMIWNAVTAVGGAERAEFARRLLATGCTYLVAGGHDCEAWHDSADHEFIALDLPEPEYELRFLMTTWHTDESLEDVATCFVDATFPAAETGMDQYTDFVVVQYGGDWPLGERLRAAVIEAAMENADER